MKHILSITFLLAFFNLLALGQSGITILKGKVIDQETNEGIAFVSIGIEGTFSGTASNPDGFFELRIPEEQQNKNLYFSAIGYKNNSYPISDFLQKQNITISLIPQSYKIESIDIAAESMVLQRILRTAAERVPMNYISVPMNMKIYYEERKSTDNEPGVTSKNIIDLYDAKGYAHPSWANAFKNRVYQITEVQRSVPALSFDNSANNFDEMLEMDLARLSNTILNPKLLNDFKLKMEAKTRFNNDSVWIISYEALKLDIAHTGSFYPTSFKGKIYIAHDGYTVLRNEIHITEAKANPQGRSLAVKNRPNSKSQINIITGYKNINGKYVLAFIDSEKQYTSTEKKSIYESEKIVILNVDTINTRPIDSRDYFVEAKQNDTFWQNFVVPSK